MQDRRKKIWLLMAVGLVVSAWIGLYRMIPDTIYASTPEEISAGQGVPVVCSLDEKDAEVFASGQEGEYRAGCRFLGVIPLKSITVRLTDTEHVIPAGETAGILMNTDGVYVADTAKVQEMGGTSVSPADHIIQPGDYILAVNSEQIETKEDLIRIVNSSEGEDVVLLVRRDGKEFECRITPVKTGENEYRLGLWVRDDLAGVGTLTFVQEDGTFGALGHGISSTETGNLVSLREGSLYESEIAAVNRGRKGAPGELVGLVYYTSDQCLGKISANTKAGIFGKLEAAPESLSQAEPIAVAHRQQVHTGKAFILSSVDGTVRQYEIEVEEVRMNSRNTNKSMLIHVTDPDLLEKTGGIVQGMSGSPIIQEGKLAGAVTHVLVSDPSRGYAVFAETMLQEAESVSAR